MDEHTPKPVDTPAREDVVLFLVDGIPYAYQPAMPILRTIPNTEKDIQNARASLLRSRAAWLN